ncbi:MAG: DUF2155 domain-containing protein [Magnetococcus sp. DMHC-8]
MLRFPFSFIAPSVLSGFRSLAVGAGRVAVGSLCLVLVACQPEQRQESAYLALDARDRDRLPLAPHVLNLRARPTAAMSAEQTGVALRFMVLDKRTLKIHRLVTPVGQRYEAPWGGALYPTAYAHDLIIREGRAMHGPEGYFNPAVWVVLEDSNGQPLHEGWFFTRDSAQTAWDHPRYDVTFLGVAESVVPEKGRAAGAGAASSRKRIASSPAGVAEPQDDMTDPAEGPTD